MDPASALLVASLGALSSTAAGAVAAWVRTTRTSHQIQHPRTSQQQTDAQRLRDVDDAIAVSRLLAETDSPAALLDPALGTGSGTAVQRSVMARVTSYLEAGLDDVEHYLRRESVATEADAAERALEEAKLQLAATREQAYRMATEVDDYADGKLANLEVVLSKTLSAVSRGRQLIYTKHESSDEEIPQEVREIDDYVDTKLANFEVVLLKTLQAVERGRRKISGVDDRGVAE